MSPYSQVLRAVCGPGGAPRLAYVPTVCQIGLNSATSGDVGPSESPDRAIVAVDLRSSGPAVRQHPGPGTESVGLGASSIVAQRHLRRHSDPEERKAADHSAPPERRETRRWPSRAV